MQQYIDRAHSPIIELYAIILLYCTGDNDTFAGSLASYSRAWLRSLDVTTRRSELRSLVGIPKAMIRQQSQ